jgi:hypothetical protein
MVVWQELRLRGGWDTRLACVMTSHFRLFTQLLRLSSTLVLTGLRDRYENDTGFVSSRFIALPTLLAGQLRSFWSPQTHLK